MSDNSAFSKKRLENVAPVNDRGGLLEELNLPPQVVSFIRQNKKNLQILAACMVAAVLAWTVYDYYTETQREKSSSQLAVALQEKQDEARAQALQQIGTDYSRTAAALWSRFELAHIKYRAGNLDEAIIMYSELLSDLASDNPMLPLVKFSLGQTLESKGDLDQALAQYRELSGIPGFVDEGFAGLGRVYELQNEPAKAREAYEKYLAGSHNASQASQVELIRNKLSQLKAE